MVDTDGQEFGAGALRTDDGSWTLLGPGHGEPCHSRSGARSEARRHAEVVLPDPVASRPGPLRILDVGLGPGLNLAAAFERRAALAGEGAPIEALALELDRDLLRRALALPPDPDPGFQGRVGTLRAALALALAQEREGRWVGPVAPGFVLELRLGDARRTLVDLPAGRFDGVFLDPFSPGVDGALWEPVFLAEVARRMAPGARLATYSAATRVRAALAAAGLVVGATPRLGAKAEGTVASAGGDVPPLAPRVARRVARRAQELAAAARQAREQAAEPAGERLPGGGRAPDPL